MLTVSQLVQQLENVVSENFSETCTLVGEVNNWSISRGHAYFSIKDQLATISAIMWKSHVQHLKYNPKLGDVIEVKCKLRVWGKYGKVQIIVESMKLATDEKGERQKQLEEWTEMGNQQGWFEPSIKKSVSPTFKKISIVTSKTGAALQDCISVIKRRCPNAELWIHDAVVQGPQCPNTVALAIKKASEDPSDVVIVCRGGGSKDDLYYWNHPLISEAVYDCQKPVVSGVGHQIDVSLVDLAADINCPTPSVAAEKTVINERQTLDLCRQKLVDFDPIQRKEEIAFRLSTCHQSIMRFLTNLVKCLDDYTSNRIDAVDNRLKGADARLMILDPQNTLNRGYTLVRSKTNRLCTRVNDVVKLRNLSIQFADGLVEVELSLKKPLVRQKRDKRFKYQTIKAAARKNTLVK